MMADNERLFSKMPVFLGSHGSWHTWKRKFYVVLDSADLLGGLTETRPANAPEGADEGIIQAAREAQEIWDKEESEYI